MSRDFEGSPFDERRQYIYRRSMDREERRWYMDGSFKDGEEMFMDRGERRRYGSYIDREERRRYMDGSFKDGEEMFMDRGEWRRYGSSMDREERRRYMDGRFKGGEEMFMDRGEWRRYGSSMDREERRRWSREPRPWERTTSRSSNWTEDRRRENDGALPEKLASMSINKPSSSGASATEKKSRFTYIPDNFKSIDQVTSALRESGLESSNVIVGIDFTKSNEWTGKNSFNNRSLHAIGDELNPYEKAITVIGKTLAPFDEDNLIPCFGFGDVTTHDSGVFSFNSNGVPCHGFEEVLSRYREIASSVVLSGPTSFGPIIEAAIDIVEESGGQFHVLVIIADGQVTRSINTEDGYLSKQERETIDAIVLASSLALSVVLVGVGDGPWEDMKKFDDKIPARRFDNFQFVNFTSIMESPACSEEKDALFALAALMEIPFQYKATIELNLLNQKIGKARIIVPCSPPGQIKSEPPGHEQVLKKEDSSSPASTNGPSMTCPICLDKSKNLAFGCGHMTCIDCGQHLQSCPICRQRIKSRLRLYSG